MSSKHILRDFFKINQIINKKILDFLIKSDIVFLPCKLKAHFTQHHPLVINIYKADPQCLLILIGLLMPSRRRRNAFFWRHHALGFSASSWHIFRAVFYYLFCFIHILLRKILCLYHPKSQTSKLVFKKSLKLLKSYIYYSSLYRTTVQVCYYTVWANHRGQENLCCWLLLPKRHLYYKY